MFRMAACRYAAMLIVEPMLREYTVDTIYQTTDLDTIYSLLAKRCERDPDDLVAQWQDDETRQWHDVSAGQMNDRVREVAKGLLGLGVKPGSMVVIYAATCYEWGVVDFACASIGAVSVPVYETDSPKQTGDIVAEVEPVIAFAGDDSHAQILEQIRAHSESLRYVFNFKANGLDAVADFGESVSDEELDKAIGRVRADDLFTIVYTSGSTGKPKGVMLSHRNFNHTVYNGYEVLNDMLYQPSRLLLFLPLAHCFARYIQYVAIGSHGVVGYISSAKRLLADLRGFKPTYLLGVPRVFEKVYNAASRKAGTGFKGRMFAQAAQCAREWSRTEQDGGKHSASQRARHAMFETSVYRAVRGALGPNIRYVACGGAPLSADLAHFFAGIGLPMIQGYGMTETAAPFTVTRVNDNKIGTVGQPAPGSSVRIADDGEVQVRGANVFRGYHNLPEKTAETFTADGWLKTGDLGSLDEDGRLTITGRKKDIIITAGGKNVSPIPMEQEIAKCPIVEHAVVVGDNRPFIGALVTLDPEGLAAWLPSVGLSADTPLDRVAATAAVHDEIQKYVDKANATVSRAESVRKFVVLDAQFTQENKCLTPSLKVVRPAVNRVFADVIDQQLYAGKR